MKKNSPFFRMSLWLLPWLFLGLVGPSGAAVSFSPSADLSKKNELSSLRTDTTSLRTQQTMSLYSAPLSLAQLTEQARRANTAGANPGPEAIAIVYPDIPEPYRSAFAKILDGIEERTKVKLHSYALGPSPDFADLSSQLKRNGIKVVIALGRQGLEASAMLGKDIAVVVGGVLSVPEADSQNMNGISLTPDPSLLFLKLRYLVPAAKRVFVVYNPATNEWLIRLAREAARVQGLELVTFPVKDLASAAHIYESTFAMADGRRDAIWLPQDSITADENVILPLVLKEAWNKSIPLFSSNRGHVKRGALFSLYPNNLELGHSLGYVALKVLAGDQVKRGINPLTDVYTAFNSRTASHVGISIDEQQLRSFEFIYPSP